MATRCDVIFLMEPQPVQNPADEIPQLPPTAALHFVVTPSSEPGNLMALATWDLPERFD